MSDEREERHEIEELPTGKQIFRHFDEAGQLTSETHTYVAGNILKISLGMDFEDGVKVGEMYIVKNRGVARARYEQARKDFPDMPPPDTALEDTWGEVVKAANRERQQQRQAAKAHKPDPETARQIDDFCLAMMERGQREDAVSWIESSKNMLGELSHKASQGLVAKLIRLGCKQIYACEIDSYDDGFGNTGHIVVELPTETDRRKSILREISRLVERQGYSAVPDDGQRYTYVKLD